MTSWLQMQIGKETWHARRTLDGRLEVQTPGKAVVHVIAEPHHWAQILGPKWRASLVPEVVTSLVDAEQKRIDDAEAARQEAERAKMQALLAAERKKAADAEDAAKTAHARAQKGGAGGQ